MDVSPMANQRTTGSPLSLTDLGIAWIVLLALFFGYWNLVQFLLLPTRCADRNGNSRKTIRGTPRHRSTPSRAGVTRDRDSEFPRSIRIEPPSLASGVPGRYDRHAGGDGSEPASKEALLRSYVHLSAGPRDCVSDSALTPPLSTHVEKRRAERVIGRRAARIRESLRTN